jgi:hypothetical protein
MSLPIIDERSTVWKAEKQPQILRPHRYALGPQDDSALERAAVRTDPKLLDENR